MRYSDFFGFVEIQETAPGVMEEVVTERPYLGNVVQRTEALSNSGSVIPEYRTTTSVSVLSDGTLAKSYKNLRYIHYMGEMWSVSSIIQEPPRLTVYIGDMYNGPVPTP